MVENGRLPKDENTRPAADRRRSIGFYLPRSVFPASRGQLVCEARRSHAPDEVVALLRRLAGPPATYTDLQAVVDELSNGLRAAGDR